MTESLVDRALKLRPRHEGDTLESLMIEALDAEVQELKAQVSRLDDLLCKLHHELVEKQQGAEAGQ